MQKFCFVSIDVEPDFGKQGFQGVECLNKILAILKKEAVPATLFVSGEVLAKYPEKFREYVDEGFEIASHGFTHRFWLKNTGPTRASLSLEQRKEELENFLALYKKIFDSLPAGFRAPSHLIDTEGLRLLQEKGFLYDSSVLPHYPFFKKYRGFLGKAPKAPYQPSAENCRRKASPSSELGELRRVRNSVGLHAKILEIPVSGQIFGIPLVGAWLRKLPFSLYRFLFLVSKPTFITLTLHSWDSMSQKTLRKFCKLLHLLQKEHYQFLTGKQLIKGYPL